MGALDWVMWRASSSSARWLMGRTQSSDSVAAVEKLKSAHRASLAELDALFAALQHRAFRGEL